MEKNYNYLKSLYSNFRDFQLHEGLYVEDYAPPENSIFLYPAETEYNPYDFQEIQTFEIDFFIYEQNFTIGMVDEIINILKNSKIGGIFKSNCSIQYPFNNLVKLELLIIIRQKTDYLQ